MGLIRKRKTTGTGPITTQLQGGELAVNLVENTLSIGNNGGTGGNFEVLDTKAVRSTVDLQSGFTGYGYTESLADESDRWLETDVPNTIVDKVGSTVRFSDGLVETVGEELVTNGGFIEIVGDWVDEGNNIYSITNSTESISRVRINFDSVLSATSRYRFTFAVISYEAGSVQLWKHSAYLNKEVYTVGLFEAYTTDAPLIPSNVEFNAPAGTTLKVALVSVRELPQAVLPEAPFAPTSTDELLPYHKYTELNSDTFPDTDTVATGTAPDAKWTISGGTADVDSSNLHLVNGIDTTATAELTQSAMASTWYRVKSTVQGKARVQVEAFDTGGASLGVLADSAHDEDLEREVKAPVATTDIKVRLLVDSAVTDDTVTFDNFVLESRKEIGVVTASDHSNGDIVVTGNGGELVENNWNDVSYGSGVATIIDANTITLDSNSNDDRAIVDTTISTISGVSYIVSFDSDTTVSTGQLRVGTAVGGAELGSVIFSEGVNTLIISATSSTSYIRTYGATADVTVNLSNISVKPIEQSYQAIAPTTAGELVTSANYQKIDEVTRYDVIGYRKNIATGASEYWSTKGVNLYAESVSTDEIAANLGLSKLGNSLYSDAEYEYTCLSLRQVLNGIGYHPVFNSSGVGAFWTENLVSADNRFWYEATWVNSLFDCVYYSSLGRDNSGYIGGVSKRPDSKYYDKVYAQSNGGLLNIKSYAKNNFDLELASNQLIAGGSGLEMGVECWLVYNITVTASEDADRPIGTCAKISVSQGNFTQGGSIDFVDTSFNFLVLGNDGVYYKAALTTADIHMLPVVLGGADASKFPVGHIITVVHITKSKSQLTYGQSLTTDVIGDPSPYNSTDTTTALQSTSTDTGTELRANAISWNVDGTKMYKYIDIDDRDNVDLTVENYDDTAKWSKVYKGYPTSWLDRLASGKSIGFNPLLVGENGEDYVSSFDYEYIKLTRKSITDRLNIGEVYSYGGDSGWALRNDSTFGDVTLASNKVFLRKIKGSLEIIDYTSANKPLAQQSPLPVQKVLPKVIASENHDINNGAMVMNTVAGKVQTAETPTRQLTITEETDGVISYEDDVNVTTPTARFISGVDDSDEILIGVQGSEDNLLDATSTYYTRTGFYKGDK